jgi:2-keto-3-deoxy-galactonokinase
MENEELKSWEKDGREVAECTRATNVAAAAAHSLQPVTEVQDKGTMRATTAPLLLLGLITVAAGWYNQRFASI